VSGEVAKMVGEAELSFTTQNEAVSEEKKLLLKKQKYALVKLPALIYYYLKRSDRRLW
jgi:hypothetical protein